MKFPILILSLVAVLSKVAVAQITVITTADSGPGSLRDALLQANAGSGASVGFAIPGNGPQTIQLLSPLPALTKPIAIDGFTQPGAMPNSLAAGDNAQLMIELDGSLLPSISHGLVVSNGNSTIRGLAINGFANDAGILLASSSNVVEGCFIGTDLSGTFVVPNANGIRVQNGSFNRIGGTAPASRNVISGNLGAGLTIQGLGSVANLVHGNYIGADVSGEGSLGNGGPGLLIGPVGGRSTQVGGVNPTEANLIAFNGGSGVTVWDNNPGAQQIDRNQILGNSIFDNYHLAIDLTRTLTDGVHGDGPTANDTLDLDFGANGFQNFPLLTFACTFGNDVLVVGSLHSTPSQTYRVEVFANPSVSPLGLTQGKRLVGSTRATTDGSGNATFSLAVPPTPSLPHYSATATDAQGNTSELSLSCTLQQCTTNPPPDSPVLTLARSGTGVVLHWSSSGFILQGARDLAGPWVPLTAGAMIDDANFEAHLPLGGPQQFFRLCSLPPCPDALAASELVRTNLAIPGAVNDPSIPTPSLTWFDPSTRLGELAPAQLAWSFHLGGDQDVDVIVSADGTRILDVVLNGPETPYTHRTTPRYLVDKVTGVPRFVSFNPPLALPSASTSNAVSIANEFFHTFPWMFGTGNPAQQLQVARVEPGSNGVNHVVLQQLYAGLLVWGCELQVHLDKDWAITGISGRYYRDPGVQLTPSLSESDALAAASQQWVQANGSDQLNQGETIEQHGLVVLPSRLADPSAQNDIAWWFTFPDAERFVSAGSSTNITAFSRRHYLRKVYNLFDRFYTGPADNIGNLELEDGVPLSSDPDPEALSVDKAMIAIQSFWRFNFGHHSWDYAGSPMIAVVRANFDNPATPDVEPPGSSWNGSYASFSRGFAEDDVVAHEFNHALVESAGHLVYAFLPGALTESFSDVFAKVIFPAPMPWVLGMNSVQRNLEFPSVDNYANLVIQPNTIPGDFGGIHENAGIGNRAAVLLADGDGTPAHPGIGRPQLVTLWFHTLRDRLSPWATYADLVAGALDLSQQFANEQTANSGWTGASVVPDPNHPGDFLLPRYFTQADVPEVLWAFNQVGLDLRLQSGWFSLPNGTTTDIVAFPGQMTACESETVSDVIVQVFHRPQSAPYGMELLGQLQLSRGEITKAFGPITATITQHGLSPQDREVHVQLKTDNYSDATATVDEVISGSCPAPAPVPIFTPRVIHWFDNPFFAGRSYDDIIYGPKDTTPLPQGCTLVDVQLELVDAQNRPVSPRVRFTDGQVVYGGAGAKISEQPALGQDLRVKVNAWHYFGSAVRYRLIYFISGNNCSLPPFYFKDGGDAYTFGVGYID